MEKVAFAVATNLWKTIEGLYTINSLPTLAFTSALRRVHDLHMLPVDFEKIWHKNTIWQHRRKNR